ncbi:hypothetical protein GCM10009623_15870 [Nocardioides aestuarii]|uniref:SRPBCC domain-containing protein n=1 Tax=Nocardioides aestuarii TaxID=252231 RepID=A0ABW4TJH5_9ACTN
MSEPVRELVERAQRLLEANQYLTLATADASGRPWSSTVWYAAWQPAPSADAWSLELVWLSLPAAQHSQNLEARPDVGISIFDSGQPAGTGDGLQLAARAELVPDDRLDEAAAVFSAASLAAGGGPWTRAQVSEPARPRLWVARPVAAYVLGGGTREEVPLARAGRTDAARSLIPASPGVVWAALTDEQARTAWLPPAGMTGRFESFDARAGGGYRLVLTYDDETAIGKAGDNTDLVEVRFVDLDEPRRLVEEADFVSDHPSMAGTMTMTWALEPHDDGTVVSVTADDVPEGIDEEVHLAALASTLDNLAAYVAGRGSERR